MQDNNFHISIAINFEAVIYDATLCRVKFLIFTFQDFKSALLTIYYLLYEIISGPLIILAIKRKYLVL